MEIELFDHHASITFPYWESLDADRMAIAIDEAAKVISQQTGWKLYNPQLEKFIDPGADAAEARRAFDFGRDHLRRIVGEQAVPVAASARRSWWKRLFDRG